MNATGRFEIELTPQQDAAAPSGRMVIDKTYTGGLVGKGVGQMLSKRTEAGESVYAAIEEFVGEVDGKSGSFTLFHNGVMTKTTQELTIVVVAGSGSGELANISGNLTIEIVNGDHQYIFDYSL
ncbi:MAG: hypothetical protein CL811_10190 [Colwelliaceae bacterium]|nr:hypothetical protein [Colwelliaceae bacterium]